MDKETIDTIAQTMIELGAIAPIIIDEDTGEIVAGKHRHEAAKKNKRDWPVIIRKFKNPEEKAWLRAVENIARRQLDINEESEMIGDIQEAYFTVFNRYYTQVEIAHRFKKSQPWVSERWDDKWTHPNITGKKTGVDYIPISQDDKGDSEKTDISNMGVKDVVEKLYELRDNQEDNPTDKDYRDLVDKLPEDVKMKFYTDRPKSEVLKTLGEKEGVPHDVEARKQYRLNLIEQVEKEFPNPEDLINSLSEDYLDKLETYMYDKVDRT